MSDSLQPGRAKILDSLFQDYGGPAFSIRLWDGWTWTLLRGQRPAFTIVIETPGALTSLVAEPNEVTLGEAFVNHELEVEGDIFSVFSVAEHLLNRPRTLRQQLSEKIVRTAASTGRRLRHGCSSFNKEGPFLDFLPLRSTH